MGDVDGALSEMIVQYDRDANNPSTAIQVGIAYMWLGEWQKAHAIFREFIERSTHSTDTMPKFAGTAMWCAGLSELAIEEWKRGIDVDYTDASGGVTIPLHLYFAASVRPDLLDIADAESRVRQVLNMQARIQYPGLVAQVAIGELGKDDAVRDAAKCDPNGTQEHQWDLVFWQGVHFLAAGNKRDFSEAMRFAASLSWADFDRDEDGFIDRLWSSEFFLARQHCSTL